MTDPKHTPMAEHIRDYTPDESTMLGFGFAWELGYMIAVPAVLFGFGGAALDRYLHMSPFFTLGGLLFAFVISFISVFRKIREIIGRMPKTLPKPPDPVDHHAAEAEHFHEQFRPRS